MAMIIMVMRFVVPIMLFVAPVVIMVRLTAPEAAMAMATALLVVAVVMVMARMNRFKLGFIHLALGDFVRSTRSRHHHEEHSAQSHETEPLHRRGDLERTCRRRCRKHNEQTARLWTIPTAAMRLSKNNHQHSESKMYNRCEKESMGASVTAIEPRLKCIGCETAALQDRSTSRRSQRTLTSILVAPSSNLFFASIIRILMVALTQSHGSSWYGPKSGCLLIVLSAASPASPFQVPSTMKWFSLVALSAVFLMVMATASAANKVAKSEMDEAKLEAIHPGHHHHHRHDKKSGGHGHRSLWGREPHHDDHWGHKKHDWDHETHDHDDHGHHGKKFGHWRE